MADAYKIEFTEKAVDRRGEVQLMNTIAIDLTQKPITLTELLNAARQGNVILRDSSGDQFIITHADDLAMEVDLLRQNHAFLAFLDASKNAEKTYSLDEVETMLR
ncbi:MAG: hypothetical protein ACREEM_40795 [Blastocatellia bacterium]